MNQPWDTNCDYVYSKQFDPVCYCAVGPLSACVCSVGPVSMEMGILMSTMCISGDF